MVLTRRRRSGSVESMFGFWKKKSGQDLILALP
jgi:hypothetical protein